MSRGKEAEQDAVTEEGFLQSLPNSDLCSFKGFLRIHPHQISFLSHLYLLVFLLYSGLARICHRTFGSLFAF